MTKLCTKYECNRAIRGGVIAISVFDLMTSAGLTERGVFRVIGSTLYVGVLTKRTVYLSPA